jgi:hypothetical protein
VCVSGSIIIVRESIEGTSPDFLWLVKFSLHYSQHFSIAGLKAHLPCQAKIHKGQAKIHKGDVRKMIRAKDHSLRQVAGNNRRIKEKPQAHNKRLVQR